MKVVQFPIYILLEVRTKACEIKEKITAFWKEELGFLPSRKMKYRGESENLYGEVISSMSRFSSYPGCYPTTSMAVIKWFTSHSRGYFALGTHS